MANLNIAEILKESDLGEPYDRLIEFLNFGDIANLEKTYGGRQILFKRKSANADEDHPELFRVLGPEKATKTLNALGGLWVYFPSIRHSALSKVYSALKEEYDGYNHQRLARKYGYSERHVRHIVGGGSNKHRVNENQISLEELL